MTRTSGKFVNIGAGRTASQIEKMRQIEELGVCPFCQPHFDLFHDEPIEIESEFWLVSRNDDPYAGTSLHLLVILKRHLENGKITQLFSEESLDLLILLNRIEQLYQLDSYGLAIRLGDSRFNGASVKHFHGHIVVGNKHDKVRVKLGSPDPNKNIPDH